MFVCIHYNLKSTKIYKYVDMNIFNILYRLIQQLFFYLI